MNLSISNLAWNSTDNETVYSLMKKYGFKGLEIVPTKVFHADPYNKLEKATSFAFSMKSLYGFTISSIQSILYGKTEQLFGTELERNALLDYTKSAIDFAFALNCENIVFGCPKNRIKPENADEMIAVEFFREIGNYALSKNICVGMEANPTIYHTNFINTTEQALELIKKVDCHGFKLNLDVGTMIQNGENCAVLEGNASFINHVHISEPYLKKIVRRNLHRELYDFLKKENYEGFISIEMGLQSFVADIEDIMIYVKEL